MKLRFIFLILILSSLLITPAVAKTEIDDGKVRVIYNERIVEGETVLMSIQVNFNLTSIEITLSKNDSVSKTVYNSGTIAPGEFNIGDWKDIEFDSDDLDEPGEWEGRIIVIPRNSGNSSMLVQTVFFEIFVEKVFTTEQIAYAIGLLALLTIVPFLYDRHKRKLDRLAWNNLTFKQYIWWWISGPSRIFNDIFKKKPPGMRKSNLSFFAYLLLLTDLVVIIYGIIHYFNIWRLF